MYKVHHSHDIHVTKSKRLNSHSITCHNKQNLPHNNTSGEAGQWVNGPRLFTPFFVVSFFQQTTVVQCREIDNDVHNGKGPNLTIFDVTLLSKTQYIHC